MKVFIYQWVHVETKDTSRCQIRCYGINEEGKNICIEVEDFKPWLSVELDKPHTASVSSMKQCLGDKKSFKSIQLSQKTRLYFYQNDRTFPIYKIKFCSNESRKQFYYFYKKNSKCYINRKPNRILLHDYEASPILQFLCARDLPSCGWIEFLDADNSKKYNKKFLLTRNCEEYIVDNRRLKRVNDKHSMPIFKTFSFDLEVYSHFENKMPCANDVEDVIFQIAVVIRDTVRKDYLFSLGKPFTLEGCTVFTFKSEKELLKSFVDFVKTEDPHICIGYNIFGFDISYLVARCNRYKIDDIYKIGMVQKEKAAFKEVKWSSSAYQCQDFKYLDLEGRISIDLLPIVRRSYKFPNYRLQTVADFFLGETKDPLTPQGIFAAYRCDVLEGGDGKKLKRCGKYCIQDAKLVCKLFEKLQCWIELVEMAKICNVGIMPLFTQGQQIKIYSQVYLKCYRENRLVDSFDAISVPSGIKFDFDDYQGAYVFPPVPGLYSWVLPFDFTSLYPTTQIAYNIDYSTLVYDDSVPDNKCNIVEWTEDNGNHYRYRFIKEPLGVIPSLLKSLLEQRNETKKKLKNEKDETLKNIYDKQQLAYKVSANSMYGGMGVRKGYLPFLPGAICTTAKGRESILKAAKYVQEKHFAKIVYGDSVTPDTLVYVKNSRGEVHILSIQALFSKYKAMPYPQFKVEDSTIQEKQQCIVNNVRIGTKSGWAAVKRIIRHYSLKKIFTVFTSSGIVKVTADHSLLLKNDVCIKPTELIPMQHCLKVNPVSKEISNHLYYNKEKWRGIWSIKSNCIFFDRGTDFLYIAYIFFRYRKKYPDLVFEFDNEHTILNLTNSNNTPQGMVYYVEESEATKDFVYDMETDDGSFHCGLGDIVVKNTDSIYVHFPNYRDSMNIWKKAKQTEIDFEHLFPPPMRLLFEQKIYQQFLILSKKRYMAYTCGEDGQIDDKMTIRGVLLARRDNCRFIRNLYEMLVRMIMEKKSLQDIVESYNAQILHLFQWGFSDINDFVVSKLLNAEYKIKDLPADYKKLIKRLSDLDISPLPTEKEFELYQKSQSRTSWYEKYCIRALPAHKQLSVKMENRGHPVPAGSRLEYVILQHYKDPQAKLFDKLENPDYMMQHADVLRLDRLYYLKSSIIPIDQLLTVVFKVEEEQNCTCKSFSIPKQIILQNRINKEVDSSLRKKLQTSMKDNFCRCHQFGKRLYQTHFDHFKVMEELKNMSLPKIVNI